MRSTLQALRRYVRAYAREHGIPIAKLATIRARAPHACFHRWGLANSLAPTARDHFGGPVGQLFVDDDADGAPQLVVSP